MRSPGIGMRLVKQGDQYVDIKQPARAFRARSGGHGRLHALLVEQMLNHFALDHSRSVRKHRNAVLMNKTIRIWFAQRLVQCGTRKPLAQQHGNHFPDRSTFLLGAVTREHQDIAIQVKGRSHFDSRCQRWLNDRILASTHQTRLWVMRTLSSNAFSKHPVSADLQAVVLEDWRWKTIFGQDVTADTRVCTNAIR